MTTTNKAWSVEDLLYVAGAVGIVAKVFGVCIAPGARGVLGEGAVNFVETAAAAFSYVLVGLLLLLICGASFELARVRSVSTVARGSVITLAGLILALAAPAALARLSALPSLVLAIVASVATLIAGLTVLRRQPTRALGGVLGLLALTGSLRVISWETASMGYDRGNVQLVDVARGFSTAAIALQAIAGLLAAAWIGTRSRWRGRLLANVAIAAAFLLTWYAARAEDLGATGATVLRTSLSLASGAPPPFALGSLAAFLVPAFLLLAAVALLQPVSKRVSVALAFALLSHGAFDVPLQALLVIASAQWALLAIAALPDWAGSRTAMISEPSVPPAS